MKTNTQIMLVALAMVVTTQLSYGANIIWTNTAGGNWSATNNWNPNQVPGGGDIAVITNDASYVVTLDASLPVGGLVLGTASGVNAQIFMLNGQTLTLNGTAKVGASGSFTMTNNDVLGGNVVLNGALTCSGGTLTGTLTVASNSVLTAASPGMTLDSFSSGGGVMLTNYGIVNWSSGSISSDYSPVIDNYGLWNAQTDDTFLGREANGNAIFNNYGTFRKSAGSGTSTIDDNTIFNTSGTLDIETGTVSIFKGLGNGTINVAGASVSLNSSFVFSGGTLFTGGGTVTGYLIGSNAVFSGTVNCSGDTLSGGLTVASNSVLNLGSLNVSFNNYYAGAGILTNYGTVNWGAGNISCDNGPVVDNYGLLNAQADSSFIGRQTSGNAVINNYGTFRKSAGNGTNTMDGNTLFNTTGTLDIETGTLSISKGLGNGVMNAAGTTVSVGSSFVFGGGTLFTGGGTVTGYLIGSNAVFSGTLNCSGDTLSGTMTVASNSVLNLGSSNVTFDTYYAGSGILTNYGTVNWLANLNCNNSPVIYNFGLWNSQSDNTLVGNNPYGSTTFNNYGIFRKSSGSNTTTIDDNTVFNTSGTLDIETGTVSFFGGVGNGTVNVAGTSASVGSSFLFSGGTLFTGGGTVTGYLIGSNAVFSGTLNCSGDILSGTLTVASNSVLNLGALNVTFDSNYAGAGVLTNYGTVNWLANLNCNNSPVIYNYGLWNAQANNTLVGNNPFGKTTFNNYGTFRKSAGSGTNTIDNNTVFNTSGTVDNEAGTVSIFKGLGSGTINVAGTSVFLDSSFVFKGSTLFTGGGTVAGYLIGSNAVFSGTVNCSGDTLSGTLTVASNSVLNLGSLNVTFDTYYASIGILTNYGTVNWVANIYCNNSPVIYNYGLWNAQTDNTFVGSNPYGGTTFNNYGTFRKSSGSNTTTIDNNTVFNTSGTLDIETGTVSTFKGLGNGTINVAGTSISAGSSFEFSGGTLFTGGGTVTGYLIGSNAVFSGTVNCSGDTLSGALTVASNSVLNLGALNLSFNSIYASTDVGILTNYGTVNWGAGNISCDNGPVVDNYGLWNAQANSSIFGRQSSGNLVVNNYGTFRKSGGSGTSTVDGNTVFNTTGTVDVQTGTVGLLGNDSLAGGTLNFGINSSNNFGQITFSSGIVLGGTVSANLNNLYVPATNSSFAVVSYGSHTGTFANYNLPAGLAWATNYGNTSFSLLVTAVLPAQLSGVRMTQNGSAITFNFGAVPGQTYQVQYTTNLAPADWINLGSTINATNSSITVSDTIRSPQLFYRAVSQ